MSSTIQQKWCIVFKLTYYANLLATLAIPIMVKDGVSSGIMVLLVSPYLLSLPLSHVSTIEDYLIHSCVYDMCSTTAVFTLWLAVAHMHTSSDRMNNL